MVASTATPIDILNETVLTMGQAASLVPSARTSSQLHASTVSRWIIRGRTINGTKIKLEGVQTPGGLRTSKEALNRFFANLASLRDPEQDPVTKILTPNQRQRVLTKEQEQIADDKQWVEDNLNTLGK